MSRPSRSKRLALGLGAMSLVVAVVLLPRVAGSATADPARKPSSIDAPPPPSQFGKPPAQNTENADSQQGPAAGPSSAGCLTDPTAIEDIRKQRDELEARSKALTAKEAELAAREKAVEEELKKIDSVRDDIAKIDSARKKENDEKVIKIVETVQAMSPKAASLLLANLDQSLAVAAMARMETPRLSKVMNVMDPAVSSHLTELLAGVVRARNISLPKEGESASAGAAATTPSSAKGGENQNGQTHQ